MQNNTLEEIKIKLLKFLDAENNVVNINGVQDVLSMLERYTISKEDLERTRIGRYVNEMRRKTTNKDLAKRTKALISHWQKVVENEKTGSQKQTLQSSTVSDESNNKIETIKEDSKNSYLSDVATSSLLNDSKINMPKNKHMNGKLINDIKSKNCDKSFNSSTTINDNSCVSEVSAASHLKTSLMPIIKKNGALQVNSYNNEFLHQIHQNGKKLNGSLLSTEFDHNLLNNKRKVSGELNSEMPKRKKIKTESLINNHHQLTNGKILTQQEPDTKILICKVVNDLKCTISTKRISPEPSTICDPNSSKISPLSSNNSPCIPKAVALSMQKANSFNGSLNLSTNSNTKIKKNGETDLSINFSTVSSNKLTKSSINKMDSSSLNANIQLLKTKNDIARKPSLPDLKLMALSKPTFTNRKIETTAELYKKLQENGIVKSLETPSILRNTKYKTEDEDFTVKRNKKKIAKLEPPPSSAKQIGEAKNDMIKKYLLSATDINTKTNISTSYFQKRENERNSDVSLNLLNSFQLDTNQKVEKNDIIDISTLQLNSEEYKKALFANPWAFLPKIDPDTIDWEDEGNDSTIKNHNETSLDAKLSIDKILNEKWVGVNGNLDFENNFKTWTDIYSMPSSQGKYLHLLPYVSLDF